MLGTVILLEDLTERIVMERSRDEFFSIASHELRTPLTAIRGNTKMMQDYYPEQFKDPQLKEMLSDIHDSSIRLIEIVNDFLDTSRLEQGKIQFRPTVFNPVNLVEQVLKEYRAGGISPGLYLKFSAPKADPQSVMADFDRLKQVIINLIGNGLKYTDKGGITVSIENVPGFVEIAVTDTGHGIPEDSQHLLFRKFQQTSNNILTRDSTRSTGLGLYISKLIMTSMEGHIRLDRSQIDKGSTFVISIPVAKEKKHAA